MIWKTEIADNSPLHAKQLSFSLLPVRLRNWSISVWFPYQHHFFYARTEFCYPLPAWSNLSGFLLNINMTFMKCFPSYVFVLTFKNQLDNKTFVKLSKVYLILDHLLTCNGSCFRFTCPYFDIELNIVNNNGNSMLPANNLVNFCCTLLNLFLIQECYNMPTFFIFIQWMLIF